MKNLRLSILVSILVVTAIVFQRQFFVDNEWNFTPSNNQESTSNATTTTDVAESDIDDSNTACNVARVKIHDFIDVEETYYDDKGLTVSSENIVKKLEEIGGNANWKAVLLAINSPGGSPAASEEIVNALKRFNKPIVAVIKSVGTSGAYLVASAANYIFASHFSDVGSIGVTWSYVDNSLQNKKEGLTYNILSSGKFKDMHDPDKPLTAEEKNLIMKGLLKAHELFVTMVAENREVSVEKIQKLADGSTMMGDDALVNGLIDSIGDEYEARQWLRDKLREKANVCDYELSD